MHGCRNPFRTAYNRGLVSVYRSDPSPDSFPVMRPSPPPEPVDQRRWIRRLGLERDVEAGECWVRVLSVNHDRLRREARVVYLVYGPGIEDFEDCEMVLPDEVWAQRARRSCS